MLAVRLNEALENELSYFSKLNAVTKTDVVKEALELYFYTQKKREQKTAYELGADLFGLDGSSETDLSTTYKKRLKEKLSAKHNINR
jgi:hypothetical protein